MPICKQCQIASIMPLRRQFCRKQYAGYFNIQCVLFTAEYLGCVIHCRAVIVLYSVHCYQCVVFSTKFLVCGI